MKHLLILFLVSFSSTIAFTQTNTITISSRAVGWVHEDLWHYRNQVKIDLANKKIYFRKNQNKKFREIILDDKMPYLYFFEDSLSYPKLDSLAKNNFFEIEVGFLVTFESACLNYPYLKFSKGVEFGYPKDAEATLERIIHLYYDLRKRGFAGR